jgi:hypothetical protein
MTSALRGLLCFLLRPRQLVLLVATVVCVAAAAVAATPLHDPDVWWVAAAGRELLSSAAVPRHNLFSFTDPSREWVFHEWLLGAPYAWGLGHFGPKFFVAWTAVLLPLGVGLVLAGTVGRMRHLGAGLLVVLVAVVFFGSRLLSARPSGVAQLFPLALTLVAFSPSFGPAKALWAVSLELVWTNTHGSFPLGVALLAVAAFDKKRDRGWRLGATGCAALATCVNPYGLRLHRFVLDYALGRDPTYAEIHARVYEFKNILDAWGHTSFPSDAIGWILAAALAASAWRRRICRLRASLCLVLLAAAVLQVRHIELAGLLTCLLLVDRVDELALGFKLADPGATGAHQRRTSSVLVLLASLVGAGLFLPLRRAQDGEWISQGPELPAALSQVPDGAHLYVPFSETGIAIWYGVRRGVRVFYDARNDCYSRATIRAFFSLSDPRTPRDRRRRTLEGSGTDAVLVRSGHPLLSVLERAPEWTLAYRARTWRLYLLQRHRVRPGVVASAASVTVAVGGLVL